MFEEFDLDRFPDMMLSGGAEGADSAFGKAASKKGHKVVHWTFDGHKSRLRSNLFPLDANKLRYADPYIVRASKGVLRYLPTNEYVKNLLRRNYYQVAFSESVYAVGRFQHQVNHTSGRFKDQESMLSIDGGTAWACQMYVDRFIFDQEPMKACQLYFYDMQGKKWYKWQQIWREIGSPPSPSGVYAGIGSRELTDNGLSTIFKLYD